MQEKSWIEIFEELGLDTDIFDYEKWDKKTSLYSVRRFF